MLSRSFSKLTGTISIRCSFIQLKEGFKSIGISGKISPQKTPKRYLSNYSTARFPNFSKQFRHFSINSKPSLLFSCTVVGTYSVVYAANKLILASSWETTKNFLVKSVKAIHPAANNFIADVVDKTGPAVALLEIKKKHPSTGNPITVSNGSGFLVRPNGLILTSAHVVSGVGNSGRVKVKLHDGEVYRGHVTAIDQGADLALVKIETKEDLPYIPLESSSNVRPGEFVVAMGSPLALTKTATGGIVSSKHRKGREIGRPFDYMEYIQTDAFIYFGNSGGPLVNLNGEAIGINNLRLKSGISFAIPSDNALKFLEEAENSMKKSKSKTKKISLILMGQEVTSKGRFVGITMLSLTPQLIEELRESIPGFHSLEHGVYVHTVIVASPAYEAGLHAGDIIVEVNGNKIFSAADIYKIVETDPKLRAIIVRGNTKKKLEIITDELF